MDVGEIIGQQGQMHSHDGIASEGILQVGIVCSRLCQGIAMELQGVPYTDETL